MDMLIALGLSIGVLLVVWTYVALGVAALPVWVGIIAWAAFFAAGGKTEGLTKTLVATLSGVFWAFVALWAHGRFGGDNVLILSLLVGVVGFAMVVQAKVPALSFIPGAFLGAAAAVSVVVGAQGTWLKTIIALVAGALLGFVSEALAGMLARRPATEGATARAS